MPDTALCRSHHDVSDLASAAKQQAKKQTGNSVFINKRRVPETLAEGRSLQLNIG